MGNTIYANEHRSTQPVNEGGKHSLRASRVGSHRKPPAGTYPTDDEIAQLVYEMFLERAWTLNGGADCWRIAEAELLDRAARRVVGSHISSNPDEPRQ